MNNVKKNFQTKSMLRCMADGGLANNGQFNGPMRAAEAMERGEDANADRAKKGAEYGMKAPAEHQPAHTVTPGEAIEMAKAKFGELRKAIGLAHGGKVAGPGGPTEDKIPAMLSNGEYVLPADTVKHIGVEQLDQLVSQTHKPTGKSALRSAVPHLADGTPGGFPDIEMRGTDFRPPRMDPLEEHKLRVQARMANPSGAPRTTPFGASASDRFAQQSMQAEQQASRAASRAAYAAPEAAPAAAQAEAAASSAAGKPRFAAGSDVAKRFGLAGEEAATLGKAERVAMAANGALRSPISAVGRGIGGAVRGVAPKLLRGAGMLAAPLVEAQGFMDAANTGTDDYRKRFGFENRSVLGGENGFGAAGDVADDVLIRTFGAASDMANRASHLIGADIGSHFPDKQSAFGNVQSHTDTVPGTSMMANPAAMGAPGVDPSSVASGLDKGGNPIYDNNSILRMQARNGQPAVQDPSGGGAQQEDPIQSALRQLLHQSGSGMGMVNSRSGSINNQFDALQKQITDTYGGKAQGTMISKLLDLQKARADALGQDQGALVSSQGNVVNADNSVRSQQASALGDMTSMRNTDSTNATSVLREKLQGIQAADAATRAGIKDNRDTFLADIQAMTPLDEDGNPVAGFRPDEVMARLVKTNPEVMGMDRASRAQLLATTIATMQGGKNFDDSRGIFGTKDSTATPQGIYKDDTNLMDAGAMWTGGNKATTIAKHIAFPWLSDQAVNMGTDVNGNPVLAYADDIGGDERFQQEVAKQSALRKKEK